MTSTLNPACPLCGLRFASKPLLELHIREDHRPRPASSGLASEPDRTVKEVTATTAAARPRRERTMTMPSRVIRALRHVNDELMRASEAIIRSARAPQPCPQAHTHAAVKPRPRTAADRADRAA